MPPITAQIDSFFAWAKRFAILFKLFESMNKRLWLRF